MFFSFIETMIYLLFLHHDNCRCMFLILIQTKPQLFYNIMTTRVASFFYSSSETLAPAVVIMS